jgi:hypothetical protein
VKVTATALAASIKLPTRITANVRMREVQIDIGPPCIANNAIAVEGA